jgi:predicted house-cleaning NTP pyrophosphatase (Maf/HAM1 superfamily)
MAVEDTPSKQHISVEQRFLSERIARMWDLPIAMAIQPEWKIPNPIDVVLCAGTHNARKLETIQGVLNGFGYDRVESLAAPEELMLDYVQLERPDTIPTEIPHDIYAANVVRILAVYKAAAALGSDPRVTHGLGLDTDCIVEGQESFNPLGKSSSRSELFRKLARISGNTVQVHSAAVFLGKHIRSPLSLDTISIKVKFRTFQPDDYFRSMGGKRCFTVPGGIDLSNPAIVQFLDPLVDLRISRMDAYSVADVSTQPTREVRVRPTDAPVVVSDLVRGAPKRMIQWVVYNGFEHPGVTPIL